MFDISQTVLRKGTRSDSNMPKMSYKPSGESAKKNRRVLFRVIHLV